MPPAPRGSRSTHDPSCIPCDRPICWLLRASARPPRPVQDEGDDVLFPVASHRPPPHTPDPKTAAAGGRLQEETSVLGNAVTRGAWSQAWRPLGRRPNSQSRSRRLNGSRPHGTGARHVRIDVARIVKEFLAVPTPARFDSAGRGNRTLYTPGLRKRLDVDAELPLFVGGIRHPMAVRGDARRRLDELRLCHLGWLCCTGSPL